MTTWFVTRHRGAVQWAADAGIQVTGMGIIEDLDPAQVQSGDTVVGTLPVNLAARVIARGAEYLHLALELPLAARGRELTADDMRRYGACLERYDIHFAGSSQTRIDGAADESVMVVIASGQTIPNLLPLLALGNKPSHLYLAVSGSDDARASAENIKRVATLLDLPVSEFGATPVAPLTDVQTFARQCFKDIRSQRPGARIIVNATGGTKIMSAGFASALGPAGEVIYCDTTNDRIEYFSPQGREPRPLPNDLLDLETYLLAQGQRVVACASASSDGLDGAKSRQAVTRALVNSLGGASASLATRDIALLNGAASQALYDSKSHSHWRPQQKVRSLSPGLQQKLTLAGLFLNCLTAPSGEVSFEFSSEAAAQYLCGGWLEEYCALTMLALSLPARHWGCGVKILPIDAPIENKIPANGPSLNELDLVVVWRNRLLIVECKTGRQLGNSEGQTILNKLEAIRNYAAGSFGAGWLLNVHLLEENSPALQRAKAYRITVHEREALAALPQLIARWMGRAIDDHDDQALRRIQLLCQQRRRKGMPVAS